MPASNSHTRTTELDHTDLWAKVNNLTLNRVKPVKVIFVHKKSKHTVKPGTHWQQSRLLPKPAINRQQSQLSPIRSTLWPVLATNQQQLEFDSLLWSTLSSTRSTLLPIRSTLSPIRSTSPPIWSTLSPEC